MWKDGVEPDLIQIPYNLFDRRFEPYLQTIKERKIEIHTRSVFLQGLFFKTTQNLPKHFHKVGSKIAFIEKFLQENQLSVVEICLGFVLRNPYVDKLVLGVDSKHQLLKNISVIKRINMLNIDWKELEILEEQSTDIVNPSQWKL